MAHKHTPFATSIHIAMLCDTRLKQNWFLIKGAAAAAACLYCYCSSLPQCGPLSNIKTLPGWSITGTWETTISDIAAIVSTGPPSVSLSHPSVMPPIPRSFVLHGLCCCNITTVTATITSENWAPCTGTDLRRRRLIPLLHRTWIDLSWSRL